MELARQKYKKVLNCRKCFWVWENNDKKTLIPCPQCGKVKDARDKSNIKRNKKSIETFNQWAVNFRKSGGQKTTYFNKRMRVFMIIGNGKIECVRCKCNDFRLLEINHINGGGRKELLKNNRFYESIVKLERNSTDLEILCRLCNAWHYLELKFKEKLPFKVTYLNLK